MTLYDYLTNITYGRRIKYNTKNWKINWKDYWCPPYELWVGKVKRAWIKENEGRVKSIGVWGEEHLERPWESIIGGIKGLV